VWGIVGMLVGALALQMAWWQANLPLPDLRPHPAAPHERRHLRVRRQHGLRRHLLLDAATREGAPAERLLAKSHFWGWQLIIVAAAITLPLGFTQGKEYAELEWPIDLAIAVTWVIFAVNFFWTLARRREKHLYVAIWFYIATIVTVAVLHIVNSLAIPVSPASRATRIYGGAKDALVQWWYGHNAVAFFLTTPVLGIMYYFLPKAADRPVYSYRSERSSTSGRSSSSTSGRGRTTSSTRRCPIGRRRWAWSSASCSGRRAGAACSTGCSRFEGRGGRSAPIRCSSSSPPASRSTAWRRSRGRSSRSRA
jgi:cbb3-type cytochrome c oxidase subunit I